MTKNEFLQHYPRLYHVAEGGSWASIRRYGLESTSALLDRFEIIGPRREAIESERRARSDTLQHDSYVSVVIRDQAPISDSKLAGCLDGMTNAEWYKMLNGFVFLWPSIDRRNGMLSSYEQQQHDILTIDTQKFLAQHSSKVLLSPINSGSTLHKPAVRGRNTFVRLSDCPFTEWRRRRRKRPEEVVAEIVVPYRIDEIENIVVRVDSFSGSQNTGILWEA